MSDHHGAPEQMTGSQQNFERGDTAPLNALRADSGGPPGRGAQGAGADGRAGGPGEEGTRPTFPPHQAGGGPPHVSPGSGPSNDAAAARGMGPAGVAAGQRSAEHTAVEQGAAGGRPADAATPAQPDRGPRDAGILGLGADITPTGWLLRGLVLVLVSVLSGVLWLVIKPSDTQSASDTPTTGAEKPKTEYDFRKFIADEPSNCADHSTMKIAEFFERVPCSHLTRALYTTRLPNGERVLTSVVTVLMPDASSAAELEKLTTQNATGNIEDLVSAGRQVPSGYPELSHDYGYASAQRKALVVIGESAYFHRSDRDDGRLKHVTDDALSLGPRQNRGSG